MVRTRSGRGRDCEDHPSGRLPPSGDQPAGDLRPPTPPEATNSIAESPPTTAMDSARVDTADRTTATHERDPLDTARALPAAAGQRQVLVEPVEFDSTTAVRRIVAEHATMTDIGAIMEAQHRFSGRRLTEDDAILNSPSNMALVDEALASEHALTASCHRQSLQVGRDDHHRGSPMTCSRRDVEVTMAIGLPTVCDPPTAPTDDNRYVQTASEPRFSDLLRTQSVRQLPSALTRDMDRELWSRPPPRSVSDGAVVAAHQASALADTLSTLRTPCDARPTYADDSQRPPEPSARHTTSVYHAQEWTDRRDSRPVRSDGPHAAPSASLRPHHRRPTTKDDLRHTPVQSDADSATYARGQRFEFRDFDLCSMSHTLEDRSVAHLSDSRRSERDRDAPYRTTDPRTTLQADPRDDFCPSHISEELDSSRSSSRSPPSRVLRSSRRADVYADMRRSDRTQRSNHPKAVLDSVALPHRRSTAACYPPVTRDMRRDAYERVSPRWFGETVIARTISPYDSDERGYVNAAQRLVLAETALDSTSRQRLRHTRYEDASGEGSPDRAFETGLRNARVSGRTATHAPETLASERSRRDARASRRGDAHAHYSALESDLTVACRNERASDVDSLHSLRLLRGERPTDSRDSRYTRYRYDERTNVTRPTAHLHRIDDDGASSAVYSARQRLCYDDPTTDGAYGRQYRHYALAGPPGERDRHPYDIGARYTARREASPTPSLREELVQLKAQMRALTEQAALSVATIQSSRPALPVVSSSAAIIAPTTSSRSSEEPVLVATTPVEAFRQVTATPAVQTLVVHPGHASAIPAPVVREVSVPTTPSVISPQTALPPVLPPVLYPAAVPRVLLPEADQSTAFLIPPPPAFATGAPEAPITPAFRTTSVAAPVTPATLVVTPVVSPPVVTRAVLPVVPPLPIYSTVAAIAPPSTFCQAAAPVAPSPWHFPAVAPAMPPLPFHEVVAPATLPYPIYSTGIFNGPSYQPYQVVASVMPPAPPMNGPTMLPPIRQPAAPASTVDTHPVHGAPADDRDDHHATLSSHYHRPDIFTGRPSELQAWLTKFELFSAGLQMKDKECPLLALSYISSAALQTLGLSTRGTLPTSWSAMRQYLWDYYFGADHSASYSLQVSRASQGLNESIEAFAARLKELVRMANMRQMFVSPAAAITAFIAGLRDETTRRLLARKHAKDIAGAPQGIPPRLVDLDAYVRAARMSEYDPSRRDDQDRSAKAAATHDATPVRFASATAPIAAVQVEPTAPPAPFRAARKTEELTKLTAQFQALVKAQPTGRSRTPAPVRAGNDRPSPNADRATCFNCGQRGHRLRACPKPSDPVAIARNMDAFRTRRGPNDRIRQGDEPTRAPASPARRNPSSFARSSTPPRSEVPQAATVESRAVTTRSAEN